MAREGCCMSFSPLRSAKGEIFAIEYAFRQYSLIFY